MKDFSPNSELKTPDSNEAGEMTELAEGARLEIVCSAKSGTVGSNPTLSAREFNKNWTQINADFPDREYKKQTRRRRFLYYLNFIGV